MKRKIVGDDNNREKKNRFFKLVQWIWSKSLKLPAAERNEMRQSVPKGKLKNFVRRNVGVH